MSILERHLGNDHPDVAASCVNIGDMMMAQNNPSGAVHEYEIGLDALQAAKGQDHLDVAVVSGKLAGSLQATGDLRRLGRVLALLKYSISRTASSTILNSSDKHLIFSITQDMILTLTTFGNL